MYIYILNVYYVFIYTQKGINEFIYIYIYNHLIKYKLARK